VSTFVTGSSSTSDKHTPSVGHVLRIILALVLVLLASGAGAQTTNVAPAPGAADLPVIPDTLPDLSAHEGKTIVDVRAKIDGLIWTKPPALTAPKVGEAFALQRARTELRRLLEGGGFASGAVEVNGVSGGVEVVFRLVPARFVRRVVIKGNQLADDDVRRAGGLVDIRDITEKGLENASQKIRAYYVLRGFPKARVEISTIETDLPLVVVVQVSIEAGAALEVDRRVFSGLPTWDAAALEAAKTYGIATGDRLDEEALDIADRNLTNALRAIGFPNAVVSHSSAPTGDKSTGVVLTVAVIAGSKWIPDFEGNALFDREGLLEILDLKNEADRSPLRLANKIEGAYRRRGRYDVQVEPELLGSPNDAKRTLRFRIHEGGIVTVAKRVYPCLTGAISPKQVDEEIDSFLDEELAGEGFGDANTQPVDATLKSGDVSSGARPSPDMPKARAIFVPEIYDKAREHLIELFRSEGFMFVEIGEIGVLRGRCGKGSGPGAAGCKAMATPAIDESKLCLFDPNRLPLPPPLVDKKLACSADPSKGHECAPELTVVLPINPGPRSYLWDVHFDGTKGVAPATLMGSKVAGSVLRMGDPLSLKDTEAARKAIVEFYRDEGYAFVNVRVTFEYSSDKSRARVRFLVSEGEQVVIDKIYVEGEKRTLESLIKDRLLIKEGGIYRAKLVRESNDRLVKLGVFQSVAITMVNPTIPAKRKSVVVTVRERPRQHFDYRLGASTGEGARFLGEYGFGNIGGYAVSLDLRIRASYQFFPLSDCPSKDDCSGGPLYETELVRRWKHQTKGADRFPRRLSAGLTFPHTPILGADVRTTVEAINVLDLRRDFILNKLIPVAVTMTYTPWQPLTMVFGADLEFNNFQTYAGTSQKTIVQSNPSLFGTLLRVPEGNTGVAAFSVTTTFDFRDSRLAATKNGYVSLGTELVRGIRREAGQPKQDFVHIVAGAAGYVQLPFIWKKPVLAFEVRGGFNQNVLNCSGISDTAVCDTYPDRLFYIGGLETNRGFFPGQMLPQDSIDQFSDAASIRNACRDEKDQPLPEADCSNTLIAIAPRGGNVFIAPRVELRVAAFSWGGFAIFLDAANTWRDKSKFKPWILRYSVGPGLSIDTPVGPVALDFGFNLSRYAAFGEPVAVFNFSIGRF
jgi:outer membrane protein insertion porin family